MVASPQVDSVDAAVFDAAEFATSATGSGWRTAGVGSLEASTFFTLVGLLVGPKPFDPGFLLRIDRGRNRRVLELDRHAIIPARIFSHVV